LLNILSESELFKAVLGINVKRLWTSVSERIVLTHWYSAKHNYKHTIEFRCILWCDV